MSAALAGGVHVTVTWLLPAVASTSVTGSGHWAIAASGSVEVSPEALGLADALGGE